MPTYDYVCPVCTKTHTAFLPVSLRDEAAPNCCGQQTERTLLTPPAGFVDTPAAG